jgi:glucose/arabinose dehydrogenase
MKQPLLLALLLLGTYASLSAQVADPAPSIQPSALTYQLEEVLTVPNSRSSIPRARINLLHELPDGSGRLFVNDLNGPAYLIEGQTTTEYLDMREAFPQFISTPGKGTGFGAFAFHPAFGSNGICYTTHAERTGSGTVDFAPQTNGNIALEWVLVEWTATDPAANTFQGTRREVLRFSFPSAIHGLQDLAFNPLATPDSADYGLLYLCIGEGGSMQLGRESDLQHPMAYQGTIFRIDPMGVNGINGQYGIPANNPAAQDANALGEVWCSGFRNPHRISWDLGGDHKMLIGDIGESNIEEVNLGLAGANYGWSEREGTYEFRGQNQRYEVWPLPAQDTGYVYPVAQYDHSDGYAVVGGFVYRGQALPELRGQYLCGDIATGRLFHAPVDSLLLGRQYPLQEIQLLDENGEPSSLVDAVPGSRPDLRFGQDAAGEVYLLTKADGKIRRLVSPSVTRIAASPDLGAGTWLPNPTTGSLRFQANQFSLDGLEVTLFGMDGRRHVSSQETQLDVAALPAGMYLLRWHNRLGNRGQQWLRKE